MQAGGSGAGITSTGLGIVDIGSASKDVSAADLKAYPYIQTHKIGGSAVVVIANGYAGNYTNITELKALYNEDATDLLTLNGSNVTAGITVVQRAEASGTEETFATYIMETSTKEMDDAAKDTDANSSSIHATATGNAGVLAKVQTTTNSIGFVDSGFAVTSGLANVDILGVIDGTKVTSPAVNKTDSTSTLKVNIDDELKNEAGSDYVNGLTRPLNYLTLGNPSVLEHSFIEYAKAPGDVEDVGSAPYCFDQCGYFPVIDISA